MRQALATSPAKAHSADGLAGLLHMSTRTLHRQLKEEGASLQQLKDEVRCERAQDLLYRSGKPVKQVAAAVGFRNEKSYILAFRQWTGGEPGEVSQEGAGLGPTSLVHADRLSAAMGTSGSEPSRLRRT